MVLAAFNLFSWPCWVNTQIQCWRGMDPPPPARGDRTWCPLPPAGKGCGVEVAKREVGLFCRCPGICEIRVLLGY